jgi:hypothetical protein
LVKLGGGVYELLQHFVANDENAVYLARRIHGLTETAKLAAKYIDAEDEQLKGLQIFLVEIVGFLSGIPMTHTIAQSSRHFAVAVLKEKRVYV